MKINSNGMESQKQLKLKINEGKGSVQEGEAGACVDAAEQ
jgi:hypothetical protein